MKIPKLRLIRLAAFLWLAGGFGMVGNTYAQWAVIDASNLQQNIAQYGQMVEQVAQLKAQLEQLKNQYQAVTGSYGLGGLMQGETFSAASIVPGSWQEVVNMQQAGKFKSKMDYYENLMKRVDPALFTNDSSRSTGAYKLSYDNTRAAFAVTDATYDSVETHRKNIEQLIQRIDSTQNVKEATDLNNRLVSENAMLQISVARLAAVQNNLNASAANDRVQAQATNAEMLRYDANYQYRTRQP
jgi:type IV secretion system protein VirB5